ncbi:PTS sugar transporter subunit IIA [Ursidibacter sp. B-7004-1]
MTKLTEFLMPEHIQQGVFISSKKRALELVGKIVASSLNNDTNTEQVCPVECFANLFKREKLGSTALNNGVALPHAKLPSNDIIQLEKPIAVFLQLETPIDYDAADNKEVDLIYAILFPEQYCEQYKSSLPQIAQQLSDKNLIKHLRNATSVEDIWQILHYADQHNAEQHLEEQELTETTEV